LPSLSTIPAIAAFVYIFSWPDQVGS
jgi:hypothetical protein